MMKPILPILGLALAAAAVQPAAALRPGVTRTCAVEVYSAYLAAAHNSAAARDYDAAADKLIVMAAVEEGVTTEDGSFRRGIAEQAIAASAKRRTAKAKAAALRGCLARANGKKAR